jgi:hypothetical protein
MTGMEKGIFQADKYQLPAICGQTVVIAHRLKTGSLLPITLFKKSADSSLFGSSGFPVVDNNQ